MRITTNNHDFIAKWNGSMCITALIQISKQAPFDISEFSKLLNRESHFDEIENLEFRFSFQDSQFYQNVISRFPTDVALDFLVLLLY